MKFFTSDTHFGHANIIKFCNRPFKTVEEMDRAIITNWNSVVRPDDEIWHLGDFTFYRDPAKVESILYQLQGHKKFIFGNHDEIFNKHPHLLKHFEFNGLKHETTIRAMVMETRYEKAAVTLDHFPAFSWNHSHHGAFMLHGHEHGNVNRYNEGCRRLDVGVDVFNMFPVSEQEIYKLLIDRPIGRHHERGIM